MRDREPSILGKTVSEESFSEVVELIRSARGRALQAVNTELIDLYWHIGEHLHQRIQNDGWGKGTILRLSAFIARNEPSLRGFSAQNLWRMRNFFHTYQNDKKLSPLVRVLPWTHNMIILSQSKSAEEREFYLRMAVRERWSKRELERQFRMAAFERTILEPPRASPALREIHGSAAEAPTRQDVAGERLFVLRRKVHPRDGEYQRSRSSGKNRQGVAAGDHHRLHRRRRGRGFEALDYRCDPEPIMRKGVRPSFSK